MKYMKKYFYTWSIEGSTTIVYFFLKIGFEVLEVQYTKIRKGNLTQPPAWRNKFCQRKPLPLPDPTIHQPQKTSNKKNGS